MGIPPKNPFSMKIPAKIMSRGRGEGIPLEKGKGTLRVWFWGLRPKKKNKMGNGDRITTTHDKTTKGTTPMRGKKNSSPTGKQSVPGRSRMEMDAWAP